MKAIDDGYVVMAGDPPTNLNVLANDVTSTSNKMRILWVIPVDAPTGKAQVNFNGTNIVYQPNPGYYGKDLFLYAATDGVSTNTAHILINIRSRPIIEFQNPADGDFAGAPSNVVVKGIAFACDTTLTNVVILVNGALWQQFSPTNFNYIANPTNIFFLTDSRAISSESSYALFSNVWTTNAPGYYTFEAFAADTYGYISASEPKTLIITNGSTSTNILSATLQNLPTSYSAAGTEQYTVVSSGLFDLQGAALDSNTNESVSYQILLHPFGDDTTVVANVTPRPLDSIGFHLGRQTNDLGTIDLTGIPNNTYDIELIVHGGGAETNFLTSFELNAQLKIGQFSFSEQDLILPVSGIPITITRTYNSMNPANADFGYNWTFAINSMNVQLDDQRQDVTVGGNQAPFAEDGTSDNGLPKVVSVRVGGGWDVTLTLPDGRTATFQANFAPNGDGDYTPSWNSPPEINYTLSDIDPDVYVSLNGGLGRFGGVGFRKLRYSRICPA